MEETKPICLTEEQVQAVARALSDPRRYQILKRLSGASERVSCASVRECIEVSPATLSHHMKELEAAGLVTATRDGKFVLYELRRDLLAAYLEHMAKI